MTEISSTLSTRESEGSAREAILAFIRSSLATSAPFDAAWTEHHGHTAVIAPMAKSLFSRDKLIENFRNSLDQLGAHFAIVPTESAAADHVHAVIEKIGAKQIAISDSPLVKRLLAEIPATEFVEN